MESTCGRSTKPVWSVISASVVTWRNIQHCIEFLQLGSWEILVNKVVHAAVIMFVQRWHCPGSVVNLQAVLLHRLMQVNKPLVQDPVTWLSVHEDVASKPCP